MHVSSIFVFTRRTPSMDGTNLDEALKINTLLVANNETNDPLLVYASAILHQIER